MNTNTHQRKSTQSNSNQSNSKISTLFVGGLSFNIEEKDLFHYFSQYGQIKKVNLLRRKDNGLSKGYAFIFFSKLADLEEALQQEDHFIMGRKIDCQKAQERPQKQAHTADFNKRRIYVGKLSKETTDDDLIRAFKRFGSVKSCYVIKDSKSGKSLNFGYVVFKELKAAKAALSHDNVVVNGKTVVCKSYKSKQEVEKFKRGAEDCSAAGYGRFTKRPRA